VLNVTEVASSQYGIQILVFSYVTLSSWLCSCKHGHNLADNMGEGGTKSTMGIRNVMKSLSLKEGENYCAHVL